MNATNINDVSKTIQEYQSEGGEKIELLEIIKDIRQNYPDRTEWIRSISSFLNPEAEKEDKPLCEAYKKVKELFTKGFPSFKLIDIPIPEVTVAKAIQIANDTIDEAGPKLSEVALNTIDLQNARIDKEINKLKTEKEKTSLNQDPVSENEISPAVDPGSESENTSALNEPVSEISTEPNKALGGSIYFTKEDCTFF
jgi:hypothetical protein